MYQNFKNNGDSQLTNKLGAYNSVMQSVKTSDSHFYGLTVGLRFFIGPPRDVDGDNVPDYRDDCKTVWGLQEFNGCPDTDGDGIPDKDDRCPYDFGTRLADGCPDADNDGVPDKIDKCKDVAGPWCTQGCPDRDGDCVADDDDFCPDEKGLEKYRGCPTEAAMKKAMGVVINGSSDTSATGRMESFKPSHIELSKSVLHFKYAKADIDENNYPALDEVAQDLKKDESLIVFITGYTDDLGTYQSNMTLSFARAEMVQKYLVFKGVPKNRVIIRGMGKNDPVIENDKEENRAKNRRIEMRLLMPISK